MTNGHGEFHLLIGEYFRAKSAGETVRGPGEAERFKPLFDHLTDCKPCRDVYDTVLDARGKRAELASHGLTPALGVLGALRQSAYEPTVVEAESWLTALAARLLGPGQWLEDALVAAASQLSGGLVRVDLGRSLVPAPVRGGESASAEAPLYRGRIELPALSRGGWNPSAELFASRRELILELKLDVDPEQQRSPRVALRGIGEIPLSLNPYEQPSETSVRGVHRLVVVRLDDERSMADTVAQPLEFVIWFDEDVHAPTVT